MPASAASKLYFSVARLLNMTSANLYKVSVGSSVAVASEKDAPLASHCSMMNISSSASCGLPVGGICFLSCMGKCRRCIKRPKPGDSRSHGFPFLPPFSSNSSVVITSSPFAFFSLWQPMHLASSIGFTISRYTMASSNRMVGFVSACCMGASRKFSPWVILAPQSPASDTATRLAAAIKPVNILLLFSNSKPNPQNNNIADKITPLHLCPEIASTS